LPLAALYSRVSTNSGEQLQALEQQQQRLRDATPDGHTHVEYVDVQSGKDTDRPAFNRLMRDVQQGTVAVVLATRLDRLSRNRRHGAEILDTFSDPNAPRLVLLDDHLDLATVSGRLMAGILSAWAIAESERLGERTAHGHAYRRKLLKPFGPKAPKGYRFTAARDNYELDDNADLCRAVVDRFQREGLIRPVLRWAMAQGLDFGGPSSFTRWLQNPSLAGARVFGVSQKIRVPDPSKGDSAFKVIRRHNRPGVYDEVYWDVHPALITREQHAWLIAHFAKNREQAVQPLRDKRIRVATGLGICSHCHKRLTVHQSVKDGPRHYRCNNQKCSKRYVNRVREEAIVVAACQRLQAEAELLTAAAINVISLDSATEPEEVKRLRSEIEEARALNNPRLAGVINQMERELELLLQRPSNQVDIDREALREFFANQDAWIEMLRDKPAAVRELLLGVVVAVQVRDCAVEGVVTRSDLEAYGQALAQE
jgi:DNA invertase Pin-like site-specific DNA recombinase